MLRDALRDALPGRTERDWDVARDVAGVDVESLEAAEPAGAEIGLVRLDRVVGLGVPEPLRPGPLRDFLKRDAGLLMDPRGYSACGGASPPS